MRTNGIALLTVVLVLAAGCAQQGRWTRADYDLSDGRTIQKSELRDLSAKIFLIADNQRHELLGDGVSLFRNSIADKKTKVAIRPPQLDLFGQDLLSEALAITDGFVLHLGDACDISNTGEFGRFAWDMRAATHGWVMAPGNHDGFFFGNSSRTIDSLIREWNEAAESYQFDGTAITSRAMQKDRYVSYYLAALILQDAIWSNPLAQALGPDVEKGLAKWRQQNGDSSTAQGSASFAQYWNAMESIQEQIYRTSDISGDRDYRSFELPGDLAPSGEPHLRRLAWHIDKDHVWRSFILQEVDISASSTEIENSRDGISILVIDTAQYGIQPSLDHGVVSGISSTLTRGFFDFQVAGEHGNILLDQKAAANAFSESMQADGQKWMLASHHPYKDLGRVSGPRFDNLRDSGGIPVTLSAHTHTGELIWNEDGKREGAWLEINVGSILDSPVEFRDLQVHRMGERLAVSSNRQWLEEVLRAEGLIADELAEYRPAPGDPDYYLNYQSGLLGDSAEADFKIKRLLLAAYSRMLGLFAADHPDRDSTYWPKGPDGTRLHSHNEVAAAVRMTLADAQIDDVEALTRFLYELREFDRTRRFTDSVGEQLRAYRLVQAIWAGRTEYSTWDSATDTAIDPDVSLLVLPSQTDETGIGSPATRARR